MKHISVSKDDKHSPCVLYDLKLVDVSTLCSAMMMNIASSWNVGKL